MLGDRLIGDSVVAALPDPPLAAMRCRTPLADVPAAEERRHELELLHVDGVVVEVACADDEALGP